MARIQRILRSDLFISVLLIVLLPVLAYLPLAKQIGYFGDDWPIAWSSFTYGPAKIASYYSTDRPFAGLVFSLEYPLIGPQAWHWVVYGCILRILAALALLWLLWMLIPGRKFAAAGISLLCALYPGFLQMPAASGYHTLLIPVFTGLLSLALTVLALNRKQPAQIALLILASGALEIFTVLMMEWMIGFEGIRLILIWYVLRRKSARGWWAQVRGTILNYLPYALLLAGFLFWRVAVFKNQRSTTDIGGLIHSYLASPRGMLEHVVLEMFKGAADSVILAWFVPVYNGYFHLPNKPTILGLLYAGAGLAVFLLAAWAVYRKSESEATESSHRSDRWALELFWIGGACSLVALFPVVASNKAVVLGNSFDRYTLTAMIGASLLAGGLVFWVARTFWQRTGALALFIGLALLFHYGNGASFATSSAQRNQFWWQLSWRAPDLKTGTVLVPSPAAGFVDDYDIFPQANLIYRPKVQDIQIGAQVLNRDTAKVIRSGGSDTRSLRTFVYTRNYTDVLVVNFGYDSGQPTCLHAIDSQQVELSQNENPLIPLVAQSSNIDQIVADTPAHQPEAVYFGKEPAHTWCYYYEKASLARQKGDWKEVDRLESEAEARAYHPSDPSEWMPFIEAQANLGNFAKASQLISRLGVDPNVQNSLCALFTTSQSIPPNLKPEASKFIAARMCGQD